MRFIYTKTFAIFFTCFVALAVLVIMQLKGWLDPVRAVVLNAPRPIIRLVRSVALPVKNFFTTVYELKKIVQENGRLSQEIINLKQDLVGFNQQARENEALRKELGFVKNTTLDLQACAVLSDNPFGSPDGLILNCGSDAGISEGQAVISQGHLTGKIIYSGKKSSNVLLLTSSNFSSDAKVSQSGQNGIVKGSFNSGVILEQIPQASDLTKGSLVVTAGINEKIPKNIIIGEVSDILSSGNDLFKKAALSSPIDFHNLEFVFVVK